MDEIVNTELTDGEETSATEAPEEQSHEWSLDDSPDNAPGAKMPEPERYSIKHLGAEEEVTREEVIALAQKGRDYDRIRERLVRLESGGAPKSAAITRDVHDFVAAYGDSVKPETIPDEVWTDVRAGVPLVVAYQRYENRALRGQLKTQSNRVRAAFGAFSAGDAGGSSIESSWYSD